MKTNTIKCSLSVSLLLTLFLSTGAPAQPISRDKQLRLYAAHTEHLRIYGSGPIWRKATGLGEETGFEVRDRQVIIALYKLLFITPSTPDTNSDPDHRDTDYVGSIHVDFLQSRSRLLSGTSFSYERRGTINHPEELTMLPDKRMLSIRPGCDLRFEALIRRIANQARRNDTSFSYVDMTTAS